MRGYKGMDANMRCRDMQYDVGKTYHVDWKIELCKNGLHFCKNLTDVFYFYPNLYGNRFFEVEADDPICGDGAKCATATLTILRELPLADVNRAIYRGGYGDGYSDYGDGDGYGDGCGGRYARESNCFDNNGNGHGNGYAPYYNTIQKVLIFK